MAKILHLPAQCSFVGASSALVLLSSAHRANTLSDGIVLPQGSGGNTVFESSDSVLVCHVDVVNETFDSGFGRLSLASWVGLCDTVRDSLRSGDVPT